MDICSARHLNATHGGIRSPGYPGHYSNDLQCDVIISVTPGKRVKITFDDFDVEDYKNGCKDFLQVICSSAVVSTLFW